jgi:hypothetical protein
VYLADCPRCEGRLTYAQATERTNFGPSVVRLRVECGCGAVSLIQTTRQLLEKWSRKPEKKASVPDPSRLMGRAVAAFAQTLEGVEFVDDIFEFSDPWYTSRAPKERKVRV